MYTADVDEFTWRRWWLGLQDAGIFCVVHVAGRKVTRQRLRVKGGVQGFRRFYALLNRFSKVLWNCFEASLQDF
jgi:hypothetical protein